MTNLRVNVPGLLSMAGILVSAIASAAVPPSVDRIDGIEVKAAAAGKVVVVHGNRAPVFSVFRLASPDRIVLDLSGTDVSSARLPQGGELHGLAPLSAVQFRNASGNVGRVVLQVSGDTQYDVQVHGDDVVVALMDGKPSPALQAPASPSPVRIKTVTAVEAHGAAPVVAQAAVAVPSSQGSSDSNLVERRVESEQVDHPGHRILAVRATLESAGPRIDVETDGPVPSYTVLRLKDPPRLAFDLPGFSARGARVHAGAGVRQIRFGRSDGSVRVVMDLDGETVPAIVEKRRRDGLAVRPAIAARPVQRVVLAPAAATPVAAVSETHAAKSTKSARVASASTRPAALVRDLRIATESAGEQVVVELEGGAGALPQVRVDGQGQYELSLDGLAIPKSLQRTLDASAFAGPIATVSAFNDGGRTAKVVVKASTGALQELRRVGSELRWTFVAPPPTPAAQAQAALAPSQVRVEESSGQAAGFATAASAAANLTPLRPRYTGRRISMEFKDIDIQNLLRLFAEISHRNIVVSDDVKGKVTIALRNVPWDQAFDLILKTHGLGKEEVGNIIRVAPEAVLEKEQKEALDAQKAQQQLAPLKVRLIPVNYALASDVADKIKDVLSDRGVVTVDQRTNVLIVKDVVENLAKAEGMVRNLDTQTPQVLIESRIVEAATTFSREIGIQWGGNGGFSPATANSTGLVFPSYATVAGAAGDAPNAGTALNPNFAVNLPAAIGPGSGGGLGFIFGSAGGAFNLNLRLSALENNGLVKTVSAPKVATLDNQEATISQGLSIPFAQVSAAGVQTAFIEARLELKVTPHVTADGSILMKINATNNQPNSGITGANGQPSISRKEAKTQMLVKDGDTTVIGGIYTRQTGMSVNELPFLGKIPILGWLFKHRADSDNRTELLIFITPRILNRQQVVSAGAGG
ncbi:MAG: type IV pilus secretin PilQ [Deltaproteobacteria bacterium]